MSPVSTVTVAILLLFDACATQRTQGFFMNLSDPIWRLTQEQHTAHGTRCKPELGYTFHILTSFVPIVFSPVGPQENTVSGCFFKAKY